MIRYNEGNGRSFGVAFNENFVNNIKDANERSIAGLILSATERGLLNNVTKNSDGRFFCFEISKSEGETYEIYFGKKPSPSELAAHPNAERAIRSSGLIRRLFDEIRFRSNCFIAPSGNISAPAEEDILELFDLKGQRISLAFDDSKTVDGDSFSSSGVTHELEVEIFASIGNHYKRMVDTNGVFGLKK